MRPSVRGRIFITVYISSSMLNLNIRFIERYKKLTCTTCQRLQPLSCMILLYYIITNYKQKGDIILEKICLFFGFL